MYKVLLATLLMVCLAVPAQPWKNGGKTQDADVPLFGTHDYIAYKAYRLAGPSNVPWVKQNLKWYFLGTEAPDVGALPPEAENGYSDTGACHCILFDAQGMVSRDRAELRVRQEFDKARQALAAGKKKLAAFYAGAMAHYVGDLSQFCHVMGATSHWGSEEMKVHRNYETAVEGTIDFTKRKSSLLDGYIEAVEVAGSTPEEIARAAAAFTENRNATRTPGWMHDRYKELTSQQKHLKPGEWDQEFQDQTGANVNFAVNAIAKLLKMVQE